LYAKEAAWNLPGSGNSSRKNSTIGGLEAEVEKNAKSGMKRKEFPKKNPTRRLFPGCKGSARATENRRYRGGVRGTRGIWYSMGRFSRGKDQRMSSLKLHKD